MKRKIAGKKRVALCFVVSFLFLCVFSGFGSVKIPPETIVKIILSHIPFLEKVIDISSVGEEIRTIIEVVRLPRILTAFVAGAGLSISGASYQAVFQNSMADPYLLGISSGAALGAALSIVLEGFFSFHGATTIFAFVGALAVVAVVYNISRRRGGTSTNVMVLAGIAVGQICSAVLSVVLLFATRDLHRITMWTMGSFSGKSWDVFFRLAIIVVLGSGILMTMAKPMNLLLLGDDQASTLGLNTRRTRQIIVLIASLITATIVANSGTIGFVGLIIPHITRLLFGPDNGRVHFYSFFIGGIFLSFADTLARTVVGPLEIPVGIVTALFGAPFFIFLLVKKKYGGL